MPRLLLLALLLFPLPAKANLLCAPKENVYAALINEGYLPAGELVLTDYSVIHVFKGGEITVFVANLKDRSCILFTGQFLPYENNEI